MTTENPIILRIYFALVSFVTLMILIFSTINLIDISLKTYIFTAADQPEYYMDCNEITPESKNGGIINPIEQKDCERARQKAIEANVNRKQRDLVKDFSMILVSLPLFLIHFRIVYNDWKNKNKV